ncbi:MAG: M20/M25/M40 family metallo-hydrolase [Gammaproteobacteria bacterium]|nr:M20/M25/M40 family metallo-hydrolase [Gammaproteobacteria bacterium]MDH4254136.1 M20/M25/M40 family metallo-hydrolase [Gammaproteobacteria bacterium]MDH5309497.1 M20/M25/M40 family metallo-hydrolase [Gammaproteobacteria bacterium]
MRHILGSLLAAVLLTAAQVAVADNADYDRLAQDILADLIAANTAPSGGDDIRPAVAGLVERLRAGGFGDGEIFVLPHAEKQPNLVIRYRSPSPVARPVLLMAHLDVVEALPEDWSVDPFTMIEQDGYYYGRGTIDNKAGAAMLVSNFIRLRAEGFEPNRDLVVMLTADEETTGTGAQMLIREHRDLIDAEFALNTDAGMVFLRDGVPRAFMLQTSEKVYATFALTATDPGGHSSRPLPDNPIARLAMALVELNAYRYPVDLNETTSAFFERWSALAPDGDIPLIRGVLADDAMQVARLDSYPYYNALARTTCVATQITGGHAENALPQTATATVNCRVLPQASIEETRAQIEAFTRPYGLTVTQVGAITPSPPSPLTEDVVSPITAVAQSIWPDIVVIPEMSTGATDGLFVRNADIPVYGISAIAIDPDDSRMHGKDERILVQSYVDATEYWYRILKVLAGD